jgi:type I restriction enzyme S subunit
MEVKPGYKQTEVGVIPEDWKVVAIGDAFDISGGLSASRDQLSSEGHCYLHYGDIHKSTKSFIDVRADYLNIPKLNVPLSRVPSKSLLADGDVVFVDASEDDEGTSKHLVVINSETIPFISGLHTIVVKSKTSSFDNAYKQHCFQTRDLRRQFYFYAVGTKVSGISKTNIKKVLIPHPPIPEQRAIAGALGDVDALLGALEKLIVKKCDLKQATMQQLLTGQKHLPGFSGEWETKQLGQVASFHRENVIPAKSPNQLFVHFSLPAFDSGKSPVAELGAAIGSNKFRVPPEAVLVSKLNPRIPRIWAPAAIPDQAICSTEFLVLVPKGGVSRHFLHAVCCSSAFCEQMKLAATGTTGSHQRMNPTDALMIKVHFPPTLEEQTAIAEVLSDMDAEIAALEQRLAKTRVLKQGMIQELLTGRTRLI